MKTVKKPIAYGCSKCRKPVDPKNIPGFKKGKKGTFFEGCKLYLCEKCNKKYLERKKRNA